MSAQGVPTWLLTVIGVLVAPIVSYIAAAKKFSGRINTTEADALWQESASIREDYRSQLAARDRRIEALEARVAKFEEEEDRLVRENLNLVHKIESQVAKLTRYEEQINDLLERLTVCETKLKEG
jgi:chromosome segregation ATPase